MSMRNIIKTRGYAANINHVGEASSPQAVDPALLLLLAGISFLSALLIAIMALLPPIDRLTEKGALPLFVGMLIPYVILMVVNHFWLKTKYPNDAVLLHPSMMILYWVFCWFALPGLLNYFDDSLLDELRMTVSVDPSYSVWGFALILVGCLTLCLGYAFGVNFLRPSRLARNLGKCEPSLNITMIVYVLVVGAQLLHIAVAGVAFGANRDNFGVLTPIESWLSYFENTYRMILAVVAIKVFRHEWPKWPLSVVISIQMLLAVLSGFMKPMLWIALILCLVMLVVQVRLRRFLIPGLILVILCVLVVPITQELRPRYINSDYIGVQSGLQSVLDAYENSWGQGVDVGLQRFTEKVFGRQAIVAQMPGLIMRRTPSLIPYQGFTQFLVVGSYVMPRVLWPDKPILSHGLWFSINYLNLPSSTTSSSAMTIFGESYIFAGWFGTIFACFILGLLLAVLYVNTVRAGIFGVLLALVPAFVDVEGQFTLVFVGVIQQATMLFVMFALLTSSAWSRQVVKHSLHKTRT